MINSIITTVNNALYGYVLIVILLFSGIYFTIRTRFVQFRLFPTQLKLVTEKDGAPNGVSSFQALMVSTASRVGTGNIIGISTAICLGGYGSIFWMWIIALIGSSSAFIESTLAQIYKRKTNNGFSGGPAYYIEVITRSRWLSVVFSVFMILTYAVGFNMLASYNIQSTFSSYSFYTPTTRVIIGGVLAVLVAICLFGGAKRIVKVTGVLVPIMGILYVLIAIIVVILNVSELPNIFVKIFGNAFDFEAIFGGFSGSCLMYGIKRGLFSNEAGVGSAPNASATADVSHPVKQGLVQVLSVFIDTILVSSATAFMCLSSGVQPTAQLSGAGYVQASMSETLGDFGVLFICVAMALFGFTTLLGNLYYVEQGIIYILKKLPSKILFKFFYIVASVLIFAGSLLSADLLWNLADLLMGAMTLINIPIILLLGRVALSALRDFEEKKNNNLEITFKLREIDIEYDHNVWK